MAAEKHVKEVLSVMLNQPLDVFDLKKIQVNATKAELETDGKLQRRVGVGKHGDPLVGVHRVRVVHVGRDVDQADRSQDDP